MTTRLYIVTGNDESKLVRASSQAQAIGAVVRGLYTAKVATQEQVLEMAQAGDKVIDASGADGED